MKCICAFFRGQKTLCIDSIANLDEKTMHKMLDLIYRKSCEYKVKRIYIALSDSNIKLNITDICKFPDYLLKEEIAKDYHYSVVMDQSSPTFNMIKLMKTNIEVKNTLYQYDIDFNILPNKYRCRNSVMNCKEKKHE